MDSSAYFSWYILNCRIQVASAPSPCTCYFEVDIHNVYQGAIKKMLMSSAYFLFLFYDALNRKVKCHSQWQSCLTARSPLCQLVPNLILRQMCHLVYMHQDQGQQHETDEFLNMLMFINWFGKHSQAILH